MSEEYTWGYQAAQFDIDTFGISYAIETANVLKSYDGDTSLGYRTAVAVHEERARQ